MASGPRADAGGAITALVTPRQTAATQGRRRRLKAGIAPVMSGLSVKRIGIFAHSAPEPGYGASIDGIFCAHERAPNTAENRCARCSLALLFPALPRPNAADCVGREQKFATVL